MSSSHLHRLVPGALMSQLPEAVDEALAGLAVDSAGLQHGLALFHELRGRKHVTHVILNTHDQL